MLGRLKRKFILIIMTLVGCVLVSTLGMSLCLTYATQQQLIRESLRRSIEGDINSVPTIGTQMQEDGERHANMLAAVVEVNGDGVVFETSDAPVVINPDTLGEVIASATTSSSDSGSMPKLHVSWMSRRIAGGWRVAIVDTSAADQSFSNMVLRFAEIIVLGLLAMLAISWFLAGWALRPVSQAWDRQRAFVADASHELKTPLSVIMANTEILLRDRDIPTRSMRWVESTREESDHMRGLVNDLLQLARTDETISGAAGAMQHDDVDLSDLVDESALEFDAIAFERSCAISSTIEENVHVTGDREWLERLVRILMDNACKYAGANTIVLVALSQHGRAAHLSVTNMGTPIDPEDLPHLFDRFYRSDKARARTSQASGFGLGLAIAKGIVEAHGGSISVKSDQVEGTTFSVTIPIA